MTWKVTIGLPWLLVVFPICPVLSQDASRVVNLGVAISQFASGPSEDWCAFDVSERHQGQDLNGDGDMQDKVIHVHRFESGETTNLGLAIRRLGFATEGWVVLTVSERDQDDDLNGDGDRDDTVVHVHDLSTGETTNLRLGVGSALTGVGVRTELRVLEDEQGQDLNGDGDTDDTVLHLHDFSTRETSNLRLAVQRWSADGDRAVFTVSEGEQGEDLNGDGDTVDTVLHLLDFSTGEARNLGVAGNSILALERAWFAFGRSEENHGDLDGDGDGNDTVVHVHSFSTGVTTNLELAVGHPEGGPLDVSSSEDWLVFPVWEEAQSRDLNGDTDLNDSVLHLHNLDTGGTTSLELASGSPRLSERWLVFEVHESGVPVLHVRELTTGETRNLGLATAGLFEIAAPFLALLVEEVRQGEDLTGDGDTGEAVVHLHNLETAETVNFELATSRIGSRSQLASGWLVFGVREDGREDLNGDGDTQDNEVVHTHSLRTGVTVNLGVDGLIGDDSERWIAIRVREEDQGEDLNSDGDLTDRVHHLHELETGKTTNLELAGFGGILIGNRFAFEVRERDQGLDLNADGDIQTDDVLHVANLNALSRLPRFPRGDCNADGTVNLSDATCALNWLFAGTAEPSCVKAVDTNDTGTVNLPDALYLLNFLFSGGPAPAAPFTECGPDPTPDELTCESFQGCE